MVFSRVYSNRASRDHVLTRILQSRISGIPLTLGSLCECGQLGPGSRRYTRGQYQETIGSNLDRQDQQSAGGRQEPSLGRPPLRWQSEAAGRREPVV